MELWGPSFSEFIPSSRLRLIFNFRIFFYLYVEALLLQELFAFSLGIPLLIS